MACRYLAACKRLLLFCFVLASANRSVFAQADDLNFTALTTKDGLSSNSVNTILKDRFGVMWFGTEDGLDKFDGVKFTVYRQRPGDTTSLQANEILSLHEDKAGNLWIGTSGGSLSLYDRKRDAFVNFPAGNGPNSIDNPVVLGVCSDHTGKVWIATYSGMNILDPATRRIVRFPMTSAMTGKPLAAACDYVFEDSRKQLWIGTGEGLFQYNPATRALTHFFHSGSPASLSSNDINCIVEDKLGNIWIATNDGLSMHKPGSGTFINYDTRRGLTSNFVNSVAVDGDRLWLGHTEGLDILDMRTGQITRLATSARDIHGLTAKSVRTVYLDNHGICWLGTIRGGVDKYDNNLNLFNHIESNVFDEKGLNAPIVTSFAEDRRGNVYVGTEGPGLSLFDRKTRLFRHLPIQSKRQSNDKRLLIISMRMTREQKLLIGTFSDGLFVFDPATGSYRQLLQGAGPGELNNNDIFCIMQDRAGNVWAGTNGDGINVIGPDNKVIRRYTPSPKAPNDVRLPLNGYIRDLVEDREGNVWIATHGGGIAVYQPSSGKFTVYNTTNSGIPNDKVYALLEDSRGDIWIGTKGGGLSLFKKSTKKITTYSETDGLQNSTIYTIIEDNKGLIWASTNEGLSSIDPSTGKIRNYNYHNGVQNNNFVHGSGLRLADGTLFFGGLEGFNYFNPEHLKKNTNVPSVLITDLRVSNRSITPSEDGPITENISVAREIHLDYKQNFSLSFVGLNYTTPEQNQYAYKLEGFDKDWNYVGNATTASYTNLDPGHYVFRVKASNNDGVWNNEGTSIRIYVHPPFWRTNLAYVLYALMIVAAVWYFRHKSLQKLHRKFLHEQERMKVEQERKEVERVRELDRLKIKFLTNLSHDFRTPISLILGPVDQLLAHEKNPLSTGHLEMIRRNGRRLLNLVNQLLDFRKMEEQELKLHASEGELVSFIKEVCDSFKDLAERKKIDFAFKSRIDHFHTQFDHDKIERILFNVLSNAFKFTLKGGQIRLAMDKDETPGDGSRTWVAVKISDTGIGIPEDKKEKIFERFFQNSTTAAILNEGTGIGLSITKEFVRLHGGTVDVESEPGKGTVFTIRLPFVPVEMPVGSGEDLQEAAVADTEAETIEVTETPAVETATPVNTNGLPLILLVEDNDDFRFYLKDNLRLHYKVVEAANGKEGWQKALATHPHLIVSDISMPYMDGIELTKKIKADKRTSHIPAILLTALTGEEDQLKGLETGANDYITKPFNFEVLNAKIRNLLVLNDTLKHTYTRQIKVLAPEVKVESENEKLLQSIALYLEENLTNSQLSVEELSRHVGMSRSTLYGKLLELTGQTPVEYIRSVKLDKAAVLLEKSDMNVAQIAYSVGFSSPNYFAKSFKAKFDMLPSEYINLKRRQGESQEE